MLGWDFFDPYCFLSLFMQLFYQESIVTEQMRKLIF